MAEVWRDFLHGWEEYRVEAEDYRVLDAEGVLVFGPHQRTRQDERAGQAYPLGGALR